ncbi:AMP-binding protein [Actinomyces sp. ZJ308]|uniref:AMP-binding protein n=1 Tax=Actinomyces sp. ZJ308 TaxID=2708342 RepID=UPI001FB8CB6C|nr:AMP-binding protein [Actinomyces sp. ZJ308]
MARDRVLAEYESEGYLARKTLDEELREVCLRRPGARAVVAADATLTYGQLDRAIEAYGRGFSARGLAKGDQVLMQLPNSAAYVVTLFALMRIGVVPTLLLPSHRRSEVASLAHELHPVAYIGGRDQLGFDCVEMVEQMGPGPLGIGMIYADSGPERHDDVPRYRLPDPLQCESADCAQSAGDTTPPSNPPHYRDVALNLLSGGTTNNPKIIPRVHEAYAYNARAAARRCGVGPHSVYMAVLSTSHDFPLANPGILGTLLHGGTVVMCHTAAFDEAFAAVEANAVTMTAIVPAIAEVWNEAWDWYPADTSSLRQILVGAARFDESVGQEIIAKTGVTIQQGYGLGEGITTFTSLDDPLPVALNTQGTPISSGDELRIVDPQGHCLPAGAAGEIIEKGPYTFLGYQGSHASDDCFTEDGFFRTGDWGYLDEKGNLVICGRVVEQINRLGENVSPQEVEQLLEQLEEIREAVVFGVPDAELGERTVAAVVTDTVGLERRTVLERLLQRGVARYKAPDEVVVVESIPRTNIGKADKKALRELISTRCADHTD